MREETPSFKVITNEIPSNLNLTNEGATQIKMPTDQIYETTKSECSQQLYPKNHKFICDHVKCGKVFTTATRLKNHKEKKHALGSKCNICHKTFDDDNRLRQHLTIHNEENQFKCNHPGCNKSYHKWQRLEIHMRTHTGVKPFECHICLKTFAEKGGLKTHMNRHTGNKPYRC